MSENPLGPGPDYSLDFVGDRWRSPEFRDAWTRLMQARRNHDALAQGPDFFEHLHATADPHSLSVLALRARDAVAGVVPLRVVCWPLTFYLSDHLLLKADLRCVVILGSQPLIPSDPAVYDRVFAAISATFADCDAIAMGSVPTDSFLWRYCHEAPLIRRSFLVHVPNGTRQCHTIPLPATFDEYLGKFSAKRRYNLRRQVRRLCEFAKGNLELRRIDTPAGIPFLIDTVNSFGCRIPWDPYADRADKDRVLKKAADLAQRGMLLSYVLICDGRPCAIALGTRHERTYYLLEMEHDASLASLSPGSTMFFMVLEDAIRQHFTLVDLGYGEPAYRHSATNVSVERGMIFLLRKTLGNRLRRSSHSGLHLVNILLRHLRRSLRPD